MGYFCKELDLGYPGVREVSNNRPDQDGVDDRTSLFGPRSRSPANITAVPAGRHSIDQAASLFAPFMNPAARPRSCTISSTGPAPAGTDVDGAGGGLCLADRRGRAAGHAIPVGGGRSGGVGPESKTVDRMGRVDAGGGRVYDLT